MHCPRCRGLMVSITLQDFGSSTSREILTGWSCLLCGDVIEAGIEVNRKGHREPIRTRARPRYGAWLAGAGGANRKAT